MRVASGLFSWGMAAGLLALSSRQFAPAYNQSRTFVRFTLFFLPEQVWRALCAARGAKRLVIDYVFARVGRALFQVLPGSNAPALSDKGAKTSFTTGQFSPNLVS